MQFPLVSDFLPISEKFLRLRQKFSQFYLTRRIFRFSSAKISDDVSFFSHRLQIFHFPHFRSFNPHFPLFRKHFYSPYFCKCPPLFRKICVFLHFLCFSFPPYFDHNAFKHLTMHILDAYDRTPGSMRLLLRTAYALST